MDKGYGGTGLARKTKGRIASALRTFEYPESGGFAAPACQALSLNRFLLRFFLNVHLLGGVGGPLETLHEAIDLPGSVYDALLTREERMAGRAHIQFDLRDSRPGGPGVAASADDLRLSIVFRMNLRFHDASPSKRAA